MLRNEFIERGYSSRLIDRQINELCTTNKNRKKRNIYRSNFHPVLMNLEKDAYNAIHKTSNDTCVKLKLAYRSRMNLPSLLKTKQMTSYSCSIITGLLYRVRTLATCITSTCVYHYVCDNCSAGYVVGKSLQLNMRMNNRRVVIRAHILNSDGATSYIIDNPITKRVTAHIIGYAITAMLVTW
ncbi:hypothetical protein GJ496_009952 [Pomphorhynchus laevis]|nr:hypothetical protein GJ496_009952 [Pomphorhynchus laevis]